MALELELTVRSILDAVDLEVMDVKELSDDSGSWAIRVSLVRNRADQAVGALRARGLTCSTGIFRNEVIVEALG